MPDPNDLAPENKKGECARSERDDKKPAADDAHKGVRDRFSK